MAVITWDDLTISEQDDYIFRARYLIEKDYVSQKNMDEITLAKKMYDDHVNNDYQLIKDTETIISNQGTINGTNEETDT